MKIKLCAFVMLTLLLVTQIEASPDYGPQQNMLSQQQEAGPVEVLREGVTTLLKFVRQEDRPNPELIAAFLDAKIAPYFDFSYMAKWAAGPTYRNLSADQRSRLEQKIQTMLLSSLSKRLGSYENQEVRFFQPRRVAPNEVKVRVGILQAGGYPARIDFRFYHSESGWKVFDVSANGSSALSFYRQYFTRQARQQSSGLVYRR